MNERIYCQLCKCYGHHYTSQCPSYGGTPSSEVEEMKVEMLKAGWKMWQGHPAIWQAPWGAIYRGPAGAYHVMKTETEFRETVKVIT